MKLQDLLYRVKTLKLIGLSNIQIASIHFDSRKVKKNGMFIAIKGISTDGHNYIETAIRKGAKVILVETIPVNINDNITYIKVVDSNKALSVIAANFYNNPSKRIKLIGVTGTNGKTTIVSLLHQLFGLLNKKVGMLSTIENKIVENVIESTHTTPDILQINLLLNQMIDMGCEYCFMEVSSHAIHQGRVNGLHFNGGVFTNITRDHLDYHHTFSKYLNVKKSFLDSLSKQAFALVNKDDKYALKMLEGTKAKKLTYSLKSLSDYTCKVLENQFQGMLVQINKIDIWVKLVGKFNAYNILAVYGVVKQFDFLEEDILKALSLLNSVNGRFEFVRNKDAVTGVVDYAHTDDALKNVIEVINEIKKDNEDLITIIGCGGDRDKSKRSLMAKIACDLSSQVIITADNPRSEHPDDIIQDMISKLNFIQKKKVLIITDRKQAIMTAGRLANKNDIILVAGKGHEKFQEIKGKKIPFNDMAELKKSINII
mgnify:FL=1|tara:strand:+ start:5992 stop:7446 length:1455 start_codon:yes stop_codon:yes gene_type:complete